jgi:transcriptional regulator with XRE-family HTH domain
MFMETSVKERLKQFIDTLNISEREFCRRIGVSSSYVMSIKKSIQPDKMQAISIHFPELNPLWLLLGQGEMLLSDGKQEGEQRQNTGGLPSSELLAKLLEEANNEKARLLSIIESQQRTIESLTELNKKANAQTVERAGCANAV